ncbi:hypothetical protein HPG69_017551 [Diceros bicornis minor]|uniref:Interleukin-17D n=1 Tax=Diceros bicornis minor TaxID=77932 RepID=A0A7J7EKV3_DICBM|nr:hypothetical protein HPG69_017551 [Diceros bicornis minor]
MASVCTVRHPGQLTSHRAQCRGSPVLRPRARLGLQSLKQTPFRGRPFAQGLCSRCATAGAKPVLSPRRISYDPARYPRYLPEAYCLCRGCLTGLSGEEDLRFRSAPVLVPTVVLRRTPGCAGGRAVYAEEYLPVPVGCTCVPAPDKEAAGSAASPDERGAGA